MCVCQCIFNTMYICYTMRIYVYTYRYNIETHNRGVMNEVDDGRDACGGTASDLHFSGTR
jgi:hypothetical protein